jgi:hypothetical protein
MNTSAYCLILGGVASLLIAGLHVGLAFRPQWYRYFGADELVQLHEQGSRFPALVTIGLALMFIGWGAYALSGVGLFRPLPLPRASLIAIGVIYVLRSVMLPSELLKVLLRGYPLRFVVFSGGSLTAGLLYLVGTLAR